MTREIALHCMKSYSELHSDLCELCPIYGQTGSDHCFEDALQYVIGMLEREPKKGHWLGDSAGYKCNICGHDLLEIAHSIDYIDFAKPHYCPNCGAKMESEGKK